MALLGLIALDSLPIEQFPTIAPPTVYVSATYPGASAETVLKSVIVPLEEAINGVEGMDYIASTASNTGEAEITVYFRQGTDPDMAAVNVQNRVSTATGSFGEQAGGVFQYPMKYRGRFSTPEEFGNIVIKSRQNGETLRLKEVADVVLGDQAYNYVGMTNGRPGTSIMVYQTSGAMPWR